MKQESFSDMEYSCRKKKTKREEFLKDPIEQILARQSVIGEDGEQEQEIKIFYRFIGKID